MAELEHGRRAGSGVSRRAFLLGAAATTVTVAALATDLGSGALLHSRGLVDSLMLAGSTAPVPAGSTGTTKVERVYSTQRGRWVDLLVASPTADPTGLPVCLLLHGRHGDARSTAPRTLLTALSTAAAQGQIRPFAFVALDGGANNYWHRQPRDDAMGMLLDEVPRWLAERNLGGPGGQPFAVAGISMGGFGSLLYARRRQERRNPVRAAAAVSPALITSWPEMSKRNAFRDAREWESLDPLRHVDKLGPAKVGLWCGTEDSFIDGSRRFIQQARPAVASTGPGRHDGAYYDRVIPDMIHFVGRHVV